MSVKTRTRRLTAGCFAAATLAAQATGAGAAKLMDWPDLLGRPMPAPGEKIAYGRGPMQFGELWIPEGKGPFPVVLMVHGGCWLSGVARLSIMNYAADDLRRRGIAVWNIEYRGVDRPGGGYPGTFQDVAAGADALATIAPAHLPGGWTAWWRAATRRAATSGSGAGRAPQAAGRQRAAGRAPARHRRRRQPGRSAGPGARGGRGRLRARGDRAAGRRGVTRPPQRLQAPDTLAGRVGCGRRAAGADHRRGGRHRGRPRSPTPTPPGCRARGCAPSCCPTPATSSWSPRARRRGRPRWRLSKRC